MSIQTPTDYDPIYVDLADVPIEVEDRYSESEKREALFGAEADLEIDRNAGYEIPQEDITKNHVQAILNMATYYLVRSATSNDDVTLGDLDDGGEQTERHAEQYLETYERLIERISEAGEEGQPGTYMGATGNTGSAIAVNTGENSRRHRLGSNDTPLVDDEYVYDSGD